MIVFFTVMGLLEQLTPEVAKIQKSMPIKILLYVQNTNDIITVRRPGAGES
jgi:hypothetical protein